MSEMIEPFNPFIHAAETEPETTMPVYLLGKRAMDEWMDARDKEWAAAQDFTGAAGSIMILPDWQTGAQRAIVLGLGDDGDKDDPTLLGHLARKTACEVPFVIQNADAFSPEWLTQASIAFGLGAYRFERYKSKPTALEPRLVVPARVDAVRVQAIVEASALARDLINIPAADMGPATLASVAEGLAKRHGATHWVIEGSALLEENFPMIHAVGRVGGEAPRLIDMTWGDETAPRLTLVGKGVTFDTGGLDLKPSSAMGLMKKDMGGAANVLALAHMIMALNVNVRLRVLIPAVENGIGANAFRPGDVLTSRKGITVSIGNTDAEGRLVLADALALADEEEPDMIIDMATLTGAARVALGPDLPPFYTDDDDLADKLSACANMQYDPLWRLPLWPAYNDMIKSNVADIDNAGVGGFAGSITAALFLKNFVEHAGSYIHLDIYGWAPKARATGPEGGEAQGVRALLAMIEQRYG